MKGIPVITAELKNQLTGQCAVLEAQRQYKFDRDPNAPIFRFKERALVHFAVDPDEVWMTTRLRGADTFFLPFNRGHGTGKGNAPVAGKHRTCYLWEEVWQRDSLFDILGRFLHLEVNHHRAFSKLRAPAARRQGQGDGGDGVPPGGGTVQTRL